MISTALFQEQFPSSKVDKVTILQQHYKNNNQNFYFVLYTVLIIYDNIILKFVIGSKVETTLLQCKSMLISFMSLF